MKNTPWDEEARNAINRALKRAGQSDDGWNTRFVAALRDQGYELSEEINRINQESFMAPAPFERGWKYDYPAWIVKRRDRTPHEKSDRMRTFVHGRAIEIIG